MFEYGFQFLLLAGCKYFDCILHTKFDVLENDVLDNITTEIFFPFYSTYTICIACNNTLVT